MNYYDYLSRLKEYSEFVEEKQLECDVYLMANAFYGQHKLTNGSFKYLPKEGEYEKAMSERYEWITGRVKETIDCKLKEV